MKKRILSALVSGALLFGTIGVNAVSISFEDLEQSNDESNINFEDLEETQIPESENVETVSENNILETASYIDEYYFPEATDENIQTLSISSYAEQETYGIQAMNLISKDLIAYFKEADAIYYEGQTRTYDRNDSSGRYGINLITKEEGIDSSNNMGGLMITILGTVAEMERENIITQTMLGREEKSRQGGWCGGFAPFGYDLKDERLVKNEYSYIVEMIFDKYVHENIGIKGIVDYLNKNGIKKPVPKNKEDFQFTDWSTHTIKGILDNPVYTGYIVFGRRRSVECINENTGEMEYKLRKQDEENYIWSDEQAHEPIVTKEVFDMAQQKRKSRSCRGNRQIGQVPKHLLSGLLKCPECGSGMVISYNR